jgi:excinuclease ABC subunit C
MLPPLPNKPGVYLIKDHSGKIIYVGKAISISKRLKSHERPGSKLAGKIHDVDFIVTANELEAFILEAVLIKKHHPKYNVLLRDDKQYPYLKLTVNEKWPRLLTVRNVKDDGAAYFGPYMSTTARRMIGMVKRIFQIRWCKELRLRKQPCFYFHLGKCIAPCSKHVSHAAYMSNIKDIELFLSGKYQDAANKLQNEMSIASKAKDYEAAAKIRDRLYAISSLFEEQKVVTPDKRDRDVFNISRAGDNALIIILEIRSGKLVTKHSYLVKDISSKESDDVMASAMIQFYSSAVSVPGSIIVSEIVNAVLIEKAIEKMKRVKVKILKAKSRNDKGLLKMAKENADILLEQKLKAANDPVSAVIELKAALSLDNMPVRIEAFDISTTMGVETVGSMVVFENGVPKKSDYRKFKVGDINNDVAAMRNVVMRRYTGSLGRSLSVPDLVLIDGGPTQLNAARHFIPKGAKVVSLAKKLEEIYLPGKKDPIRLPKSSSALKLFQRVRDEAHRFAITFHRKRRAKKLFNT